MKIQILDVEQNAFIADEIDLHFLPQEIHTDLITNAVIVTRNNLRSGSASAKTRAEVNFSTRKPFRQKGTGNARAGTKKSPLWRKGGVIFPPRPRSFATGFPKKQRKLAFKNAFSMRVNEDNTFFLVRNLKDETGKTKDLLKKINTGELLSGKVLLIYDATNGNLGTVLGNVKNLSPIEWNSVCTYDIVKNKKLIVTEEAMKALESRLNNA
jgi:large subunit ribosomal protein L4